MQLMKAEGISTDASSSLNGNTINELHEVHVKHNFEAGDLCLAPWSEDGQ